MRLKQVTADGEPSLHTNVLVASLFRRPARELFNPGLGSLVGEAQSLRGKKYLTLRPYALALLLALKPGVERSASPFAPSRRKS